ncbi:MAG TPA: protein kinase [Candidatus Acidoferrales bacterium]|nr:protein kinase [Candidatus Acidoferrales bacterium]
MSAGKTPREMIGQSISHYRIEAEIGRGGMGVVYRAHDERLDRPVALKVLTERDTGPGDLRARILAEARAAAALNHPGILTIYEVGEEGPLVFLVMELVAGATLRARAETTPYDPTGAARLALQIAEALEAAHERGRIHGDIKPENVAVGRAKLLDFGIARSLVEQTVSRTMTASVPAPAADPHLAGTLAYLAPEILRGEPADHRADLFSLGVLLFELVARHRPFPGPDAPLVMIQILQNAPPQLGAAVPEDLARIILRLLEKQPAARYQTARELRLDLAAFLKALDRGTAPAAAAGGKRSVAVLPFRLLTPGAEDEYLSVALADAVIQHLSGSQDLVVRPTSAVLRYVAASTDALAAARELNVNVVVEGSIQKIGPKIRVHVQGWDAAKHETIVSAKHDGEAADLFALQDRLSESVSRALNLVTPSGSPSDRRPTRNSSAYELYLRANERLHRLNRWDTHTGIEMLQQATRLDPQFAEAWARLAGACVMMSGTFEPSPRWINLADRACKRALQIDRENAEALAAKGRVLWTPAKGFQNRPALRALSAALEANPGTSEARVWRCLVLIHVGLLDEALEGLREALSNQPDDNFTITFLGQALNFRGEYAAAEEYFSRSLAMDPASLWSNLFSPANLIYHGQLSGAEARLRAAGQFYPGDPMLTATEALLWAQRGEKKKSEQMLRRVFRNSKSKLHTHHAMHLAASAYASVGRHSEATRLLQKASVTGLPNHPTFRGDPFLQPLLAYKPYARLLERLRKDWEAYKREFGKA